MATKKVSDDRILSAAARLATAVGYRHLTRRDVAANAGVWPATISQRWGTMPEFRAAVLRHAVARGMLAVIAQGLAARDPIARRARPAVREAAKALL